MKNCLFILNPISGDNNYQKEELFAQVEDSLKLYNFHFVETTGENDPEKIQKKLTEYQPDLVMVGGGDGTVKMAAMALKSSSVPMCVVPLGSANGLAKCLGIEVLTDALEAVRDHEVKAIDAIDINGEICLHLADFGMNASMIRKFEDDDSRGMLGYVKNSLSELFSAEPKNFTLKFGEEEVDLSSKMMVIANGDQYGTGAKVNCSGVMDDGKFEVISINPLTADDFLKMTVAFFKGDLDEMENVQTWQVEECEIINHHEAEFQIDGEVMNHPKSIQAKIHKHAFNFLVGKSFDNCRTSEV
ncbi:diacylglycerol kinase family protein [Algoriphagus halophytocola]|uniref:Diacylglycerol kinase family protein n=1 Tax=Algoriphagus halophytocola TaxID=2991499 RepID=A0ABY6MFL0_9BACT|nr:MULTISPECIES: diacylglycerol kinase family protein [unclassified Algoriphagus]UZD22581.1 diacylglycerol kinase family protein [Algoriphagus sp. TR-M5]WBL43847.1 diacylglycerol kinase family protein [Algoriphagus sp. TR-M9]